MLREGTRNFVLANHGRGAGRHVGGAGQPPLLVQAALTLALVTPMGPLVYRLAFRSLADSSSLVLLIVAVGVHFALTGLGLLFFGAEGFRNPPFWDERFTLGALAVTGQTLIIFAASLVLIVALFVFFDHTLSGKALRATSVNRTGARLDGHQHRRRGLSELHHGVLHRHPVGPAHRPFHHHLLRQRLSSSA
jgi:branched-subunit amino acid ABC-type transport system permease component